MAPEREMAVNVYERGLAVIGYPIFLTAFLLWPLTEYHLIDGKTAVWWWISAVIIVLSACFWNLNRARAVILVLFVGVLALAAYLGEAKNVPVIAWLSQAMRSIPVGWTIEVQALIYFVSSVTFLFWVIDTIDSRINGRWEFGKNEFEHYSYGRRETSLARGQNSVLTSVPCTIKSWLLLGGATLDITGSLDQRSHARLEHVFRGNAAGKRIRKLLESTQSTVDNLPH
jgi:hypothetical protein